jgi:poly(3-hydroxybutyrate) depolymerase
MAVRPHATLSSLIASLLGIVATLFPGKAAGLEGQPGQTTLHHPRLGAYGIDIRQTSVSGVSSGGAMAIQMHVAHAAIMRGIGVIAGVGYDCADSRLPDVNLRLTRGLACLAAIGDTDAQFSIARTTEAAAVPGAIDPVSNLGPQKVWLFSGYNDGSVRRAAMNAVAAYYRHYTAAGNVFYQVDNRAPHALVTDAYGGPCLGFNEQYINNCEYDAAGHLLKHIYGHLKPRSISQTGSIHPFNQREFTAGANPKSGGLSDTGYVYVPTACLPDSQPHTCRVHVVFHGCRQYAENPLVNTALVEHGGYNKWADTNNLIVLYPQATPIPSSLSNPGNPRGCWDWWGYSELASRDYARKTGNQISAVKAMIDRLAEGVVPVTPSQSFGPPESVSVADKTSNSLSLIWQPNSAAAGFNIARSSNAAGPFAPIANMVKGASFADNGLAPGTAYHYDIRAVDASNTQSPSVGVSGETATTIAPVCDPYFSDNKQHIANWRAYRDLAGRARAFGSNDNMGQASEHLFSQLTKDPGPVPFYRVRYCP